MSGWLVAVHQPQPERFQVMLSFRSTCTLETPRAGTLKNQGLEEEILSEIIIFSQLSWTYSWSHCWFFPREGKYTLLLLLLIVIVIIIIIIINPIWIQKQKTNEKFKIRKFTLCLKKKNVLWSCILHHPSSTTLQVPRHADAHSSSHGLVLTWYFLQRRKSQRLSGYVPSPLGRNGENADLPYIFTHIWVSHKILLHF